MDASNTWGRVVEDGTVYVRTADGERVIASWQAGTPAEGLAHFVRRYDDLAIEVDLLAQRISAGTADPRHCLVTVAALRAGLAEAHVVGDLAALDARLQAVHETATVAVEQARAERAERAKEARARKEALVVEAERIAETGTGWKAGGDRLQEILGGWGEIKGADRRVDGELWKRLTVARDAFARRRGSHFVELDQQRKQAAATKETLVREAEGLAVSTDWVPAAARLKSLMADWKQAPRASRDVESDLWTRFRAAQDGFFTARSAVFAEREAGQRGNEAAKVAILEEAEALDVTQPGTAATRLRQLQERYDDAGKVPREAMGRLDARMRAAEQRVREATDSQRQTRAPAPNPLLDQMRDQVAEAERRLARALDAGDAPKAAECERTLVSRREFLAQAERSTR